MASVKFKLALNVSEPSNSTTISKKRFKIQETHSRMKRKQTAVTNATKKENASSKKLTCINLTFHMFKQHKLVFSYTIIHSKKIQKFFLRQICIRFSLSLSLP